MRNCTNGELCAIHSSSVNSGESAHLHRYSYWTMQQVPIFHMLAAKALASLHICTGSPEPRHSNETSCAGSNGDLCAIHASSLDSNESAHLHRYSISINILYAGMESHAHLQRLA